MANTTLDANVILNVLYKRTGVKAAINDFNRLGFTVQKTGNVVETFADVGKKQEAMFRGLTKEARRFRMEFLGIMFGGQAIARTFGRIQRSAFKSFTTVMKTVEGATTNVGMLAANFEFLRFSIGQAMNNALAPFMPMLINLIKAAADWVETHPETTFWAIAGAFAAGTALAVGGAFMLFIFSMKELTGLNFTNLRGLPGALGKIGISLLTTPWGIALTALTAIALLSWKAFKETPEAWEAVKNTAEGLKEPLQDVIDSISLITDGVLEGVTPSWEDLAWVIAFALSHVLNFVAVAISGFSLIVLNVAKAFQRIKFFTAGLFGDTEAMDAAMEKWIEFDNQIRKVKDTLESVQTLPSTVMEFKKQSLLEQGFQTQTDIPTGRVTATPGSKTVNIQNLNTGASAKDVIAAIERFTTT